MNPLIEALGEYPFARLVAERTRRLAAGQRIIDFGMGDPREVTPAFIRQALADGIPEISSYPTVRGADELRQAIADWLHRRFDVQLDPASEILPTGGSKEGIFHTPLAFVDPASSKSTVVVFEPAYPVYRVGALYAGANVHTIQLEEANDFLPDLEAIDPSVWEAARLVWLNYPHNPTGHVAPASLYARALELAEEHDFILCADECYVDLYFDEAPTSALQVGRERLLVYHSLSKRSAMTGFRSGFIAGDPRLIQSLARFRPSIGCAMPAFVQSASIAAWSDDLHAAAMRDVYRQKRELLLPSLVGEGSSLVDAGGRATFYLWLRLPAGVDELHVTEALLAAGVMVCPGRYLGMPEDSASSYIRLALVPTTSEIADARDILSQVLPEILGA